MERRGEKGVRKVGEIEEGVRKRKGQGDEFYRESSIGEWKKNKETFKYGRRYKEEKQIEVERKEIVKRRTAKNTSGQDSRHPLSTVNKFK